MSCEAVDGGNVFAGARVVDMGREVADMGCKVVGEGGKVVDESRKAVVKDNVLVGAIVTNWVTSFPVAATSISLVSCSLVPPTSTLSFEFPGSLASLV